MSDIQLDGSALSRRGWLAASASMLTGSLAWTLPIQARAQELKQRGMSCILLWMPGGPSQFETFSPLEGHANGGETKAIDTNVGGIRFSENLPRLAQVADQLAVLRSMTTREGDHGRASHLMQTSYLPIAGVQFPTAGAVASHELAAPDSELPAYVRIGFGGSTGTSSGYLGPKYDPFAMTTSTCLPENTRLSTDEDRYRGRLSLLNRLHPVSKHAAPGPSDHLQLYADASRMILSPQMEAFDLQHEPDSVRATYGWQPTATGAMGRRGSTTPDATAFRRSQFAADCLMARRLIESGVTFVELHLRGWDTHADNFNQCRGLCEALDQPFAALIRDLQDRGLLDRTLIVWLGEFGRTPRINPNAGRDHFPRAFTAALAGGGVHGGQVIGSVEAGGDAVKDRPITEKDFFCTIYKALGIESTMQTLTPIGRPIRFVDGGNAVTEVFS